MTTLVSLCCSAGLAWLLTMWVLRRAPLDHPTTRSSHSQPTPRGGGLAIVVTTLLGTAAGAVLGVVDQPLAWALSGGGLLIAAVGWWDDHGGVRARLRLGAHLLAAGWALWWLGGLPTVRLGLLQLEPGMAGSLLGVAGIVWSINLFNFMDGIDGIAGGEALCVGAGGAFLLALRGMAGDTVVPLVLAGASLGFLGWNWPRALIFMGDVGSGFLGFAFAVVAIWSEDRGGPSLILWAVLAMVFVLDATVTLLRRALRRERLTEGHRHHAYQRLVQAGWSHRAVSATVIGLNLALIAAAALLPPLAALGLAAVLCAIAYLLVERLRPM
ncbi:MAG: glycosyltransferase family 4 protein [Gemmatimonadota bacterium]